MKQITNTALVTYQYTTGPQSVIKSATAQNVVPYVRFKNLPMSLTPMTACASFCRPFWLVLAVENPCDHPLSIELTACLSKNLKSLGSLGINGRFTDADISKCVKLCLKPYETVQIHFGVTMPQPAFCFMSPQKGSVSVLATYTNEDGCEVSSYSNEVIIPVCKC